jgi:hypothetical protein
VKIFSNDIKIVIAGLGADTQLVVHWTGGVRQVIHRIIGGYGARTGGLLVGGLVRDGFGGNYARTGITGSA